MNKEYVENLINDLKAIEFGKDYIINGNELKELAKWLEKQQQQIDNRNNVIKELEEELLRKQEFYRDELTTRPTNDSEYNTKFADRCALAQLDVILGKLTELKEKYKIV